MTERTLSARIMTAMLIAIALLLPTRAGFSDDPDESLEGLADNPPRYVIEHLKFAPDSLVQGITPYGGSTAGRTFYRITARGEGVVTEVGPGVRASAQVMLESTFAKRSY